MLHHSNMSILSKEQTTHKHRTGLVGDQHFVRSGSHVFALLLHDCQCAFQCVLSPLRLGQFAVEGLVFIGDMDQLRLQFIEVSIGCFPALLKLSMYSIKLAPEMSA